MHHLCKTNQIKAKKIVKFYVDLT